MVNGVFTLIVGALCANQIGRGWDRIGGTWRIVCQPASGVNRDQVGRAFPCTPTFDDHPVRDGGLDHVVRVVVGFGQRIAWLQRDCPRGPRSSNCVVNGVFALIVGAPCADHIRLRLLLRWHGSSCRAAYDAGRSRHERNPADQSTDREDADRG